MPKSLAEVWAAETFYSAGLFRALRACRRRGLLLPSAPVFPLDSEQLLPRGLPKKKRKKEVFFPLFQVFLRRGLARLAPETEITSCHCNLQKVESAAESFFYEQACDTNIKKMSVGHVLPGFGSSKVHSH